MLTHDARRTTNDDGRQPIAIGHLSDSGDLKMFNYTGFHAVKANQGQDRIEK